MPGHATKISTEVPELIARLKTARKLQQDEIAKLIGVTPQQLSRWVQLKNSPSGSNLQKLRELVEPFTQYCPHCGKKINSHGIYAEKKLTVHRIKPNTED